MHIADSAQVTPNETEGFKGRIEKFDLAGACEAEQVLFEDVYRSLGSIAVDSEADDYVAIQRDEEGVVKLSPGGATLCNGATTPGFSQPGNEALAVDPASDTLLGEQYGPGVRANYRILTEFGSGPGCPVERRFGYAEINLLVFGLAPFPGVLDPGRAGHVLISEGFDSERRVFELVPPPPGPLLVPGSAEADPLGNANATIDAEVNPEGKEVEVEVEWVDQATCEADEGAGGECFEEAVREGPLPLGADDFSLHAIEVQIGCPDPLSEAGQPGSTCLTPETAYRFRIRAESEDGTGPGPLEGTFTTRPPLEFGQAWASAVGITSAVLHAEANPLGIPATARFQIVDDVAYQTGGFAGAREVPAAGEEPLSLGSGAAMLTRSASLDGLQPATTYHYRLLASNPLIEPLPGPERTLTTFAAAGSEACPENEAFRSGPSALLPDCRAYELVSPLDKAGGDVIALRTGNLGLSRAVLSQSSTSGSRLSYGAATAFAGAPSAPWTSQYIADRGSAGWQSHPISSPIGEPLFENAFANTESELKALSPDLCQAWVRTIADPPLAPDAQQGYPNIYRRTDEGCGGPSYEALTTAEWRHLKRGEEEAFGLELQGLSADGSVAIFQSPDSLLGTGAPDQHPQLYVSADGPLPVFACVLPDRAPLAGACSAGIGAGAGVGTGRFAREQGALSADGQRLFWTDRGSGSGKIYMRQNPLAAESPRLHGAAAGTGTVIGPAAGIANVLKAKAGKVEGLTPCAGFAPHQQITDSLGAIPPETTILEREETSPGVCTIQLSAVPTTNKLGDLLTGHASSTVFEVGTESGAFEPEQTLSAPGIPAGTTIEAVQQVELEPSLFETRLTLSAAATQTAISAPLGATSPCTGAATGACTIAVSAAGEAQSGSSASEFRAASGDGSRLIYSSGDDLYEARIGEAGGQLGVSSTTLIAGGLQGVLGISTNATHVYFASGQAIPGAGTDPLGADAQPGEHNLYLYRGGEGAGSYAFIGALSDQDVNPALPGPVAAAPVSNLARVTPDGRHAAFVSSAPLTGYDNLDQASGVPDTEVFLYDADASRLICSSCNPSGARPAGRHNAGKEIVLANGPEWMAAWISGHENNLYASRELSDDGGRLFFTSADALLARDTNGSADVYQWEAPGTGGCSASHPSYAARNGGCVDLISSGLSVRDSEFIDANPAGSDVFFGTLSSLVAQDYGLVDIYDAHVGGGFPSPPPAASECEGEACRGAYSPPEDLTPASAAFHGAGDLHEKPKKKRCAKGRVRRHGRCLKKRHHRARKQHRKHHQARHDRGTQR